MRRTRCAGSQRARVDLVDLAREKPVHRCPKGIAHSEHRCLSRGVPRWSGSRGHPPPRRTAACPRPSWCGRRVDVGPDQHQALQHAERKVRTYGKALLGLASLLCLSVCGNLASSALSILVFKESRFRGAIQPVVLSDSKAV